MGKGSPKKEKILDLAESAVLQKGFHATSIEDLIAAAEITKSFFYHFRDRNDLAGLFTILVEGGIVMSKVLNDSRMLPKQLLFTGITSKGYSVRNPTSKSDTSAPWIAQNPS